jgi:hypothetical protein
MKRLILVCILSLIALPLWADFGLSNVVTKEIHRTVVVEETPEEIPEEAAEEPAPQVQEKAPQAVPFTKTAYFPFTIHMSSWHDPQAAMQQARGIRPSLGTVFITKIDLGSSGVWYRVDYGVFHTIKDAVTKLRELVAKKVIEKGAFVGSQVPYAIEIGMYDTENKAMDVAKDLEQKGITPYVLKETEGLYRLLVGAYPDTKSAVPAYNDLKELGLTPTMQKR